MSAIISQVYKMVAVSDEIQSKLFSLQDLEYKEFHSRLMPTVEKERIIGVRTPQLRKYASEICRDKNAGEFLKVLPHYYYEENNLHAFLIEKIKDYDALIRALDDFLPYVDNWATCDMLSPKILRKHLPQLRGKIKKWLSSEDVYTVRFGIVTLMKLYLTDDVFNPEYAEWVASVRRDEYYIKMAVAWYFATALSYQYDSVISYLTDMKLDAWTHNKTIRKAIESRRIADDCKNYLRTLQV